MDAKGFTAVHLKFCLASHKTDRSNCSAHDQLVTSKLILNYIVLAQKKVLLQ